MALAAVSAAAAAAAAGHKMVQTSPSRPIFPELDSEYEVGKALGRGCFATVYKAQRRSDGLAVAIKSVEKNRLDDETEKLLQNELEVLQAVSEHPGIVTLLDSVETERFMFFVMEYVDGGPLLDRIISKGHFSENDARVLLRAILRTLNYLSDLGCVHRDIKPENILVDNYSAKWPVKLTDFGLSAKMQPDELLHGTLGTPLFVAPEILKGDGYDCACDMWSLGVVLYLVLCGYPPFPYDHPGELVRSIINGEYSFPAQEWDHVSGDAKDALTRMMEVNPKHRLTPAQALEHPWFRARQSTSDLPNSQLKSFAKRKLKATVVAVRTVLRTNDLLRCLTKNSAICDASASPSQTELQRDVENSRRLIERMGISEREPTRSRADLRHEGDAEEPVGRLISRRSLMLPSSIFDAALPNPFSIEANGRFADSSGRALAFQSKDSIPWCSQVMSSRAKALVAEVEEGTILEESRNPFLVSPKSSPSRQVNGNDRSNNQQDDVGGPSTHSELCSTPAPPLPSDGHDRIESLGRQRGARPVMKLDLGELGICE
eukprot:GFKZ01001113.1.p1 GENE.GFKZ01001113.1~~GFKZ01001113.1.p1  ORF type:complete len:546 (+),score=59.93 GFKZ01001113.1:219-1856(+)